MESPSGLQKERTLLTPGFRTLESEKRTRALGGATARGLVGLEDGTGPASLSPLPSPKRPVKANLSSP